MIASEAVDGQGGLPEGGRSQQGAAASHGTPASLRQWCLPGAMQGGKGRPPTGRRPATEPSEDQMPPGIRTNPLFLASDLSNGREQVRDSVPLLDAGGASPMRRLSSQSEDGQHGSFRGSGATETLQSIYDSSRRFRGGITTASLPDNDNWLYDEMKGEADNLASYMKDLLDRRGDGDPRVAALVARRRRLEKQKSELEVRIADLEEQLKDKAREVEEGDAALRKAEDANQGLRRQLDMLEKLIDGKQDVRGILQELDDLKRENRSLKAKIADMTDEDAELRAELDDLDARLADVEDELEEMTELSERQKAEIQRLQDIINTPVPWWKASGCLWLLLAFFALAAIGLAIALPLAILLPKARSGAPVVYDGPVLAGNLEVLSAAGQIINFQARTTGNAQLYYALVPVAQSRGTAQPTGEEVAGTSTPYYAGGIPQATACGQVSTVASQARAVSVADANSQGLAECVGRVRNCLRCPVVSSETGYRLYVSLGHPEADWQSRGVSDSTLLQLTTGDVTPPRWDSLPRVVEAEQNAFTVSVWVSEVGAVEYVVYYSDFNVSYHRTPLLQALEEPVCSSHMEVADADELRGAVAASGSFPVPRADEAFLVRLDPPCPQPSPEQTHPGPLPCSVASQGLSPSSLYRLCLLAIDASGNRQESPTCIPLQTGQDLTPPLLNATAVNVTANTFDLLFSMNERGHVWSLVVEPMEVNRSEMQPTSSRTRPRRLLQDDSTPTPSSSGLTLTPKPTGSALSTTPPPANPTATPGEPESNVATPTASLTGAPEEASPATPEGLGTATSTPTIPPPPDATPSKTEAATPTQTPEAPPPTQGPLGTATVTPASPGNQTAQPGSSPTPTPSDPPVSSPDGTPTPTTASLPPSPPPSPSPPPPFHRLCEDIRFQEVPLSSSDVLAGSLPSNVTGGSLVTGGARVTEVSVIDQPARATVTGLRANTLYRVYLVAGDMALPSPNVMNEPLVLDVETLDTRSPVFVNGTPAWGAIFSTNFTIVIAMSELGTVLYVVLPGGAPEPGPDQVMAGTDGEGEPAITSSFFDVTEKCTDTYGTVDSNIEPDTAYDIWLVPKDRAGNAFSVASKLQVLTVDNVAPSVTNVTVEQLCYGLSASVTLGEDGTLAYVLSTCENGLKGKVTGDDVFEGSVPGSSGRVVYNGTVAAQAGLPVVLDFQGLEDSSRYLLFLAAEDKETPPNRASVPYRGGLVGETLDCEPPEITVSVELRQEAGVLSGVLTVGLNEAAVVGVQVVDSSAWGWMPTAEDILAVPPCTGPDGAAVFTSSHLVASGACDPGLTCGCDQAPQPLVVTVPGLQAEKLYTFHVAALDFAGNNPSLTTVDLSTPDSSAPRWMWGTPAVQCVEDYSVVLLLQVDENAEVAFAVARSGQPVPTVDDLFFGGPALSSAAFVTTGKLKVTGRPRNATAIDPVVRANPDPLGHGYTAATDFRIPAASAPVLLPEDCARIKEAARYWNNVTRGLAPLPNPLPRQGLPAIPTAARTATPSPSQTPQTSGQRRLLQDIPATIQTPSSLSTPTPTATSVASSTPTKTATSAPTPTPKATAAPAPGVPPPPPPPLYPGVQLPSCQPGALTGGQTVESSDSVAYAVLVTGLRPLEEYSVYLAARDVSEAPNTMNRPAVLKFTTTDEQPPEIVYTDLQALPPSSVSVELGLNEPGKAYFVTMGLAELPPTPEQVFDPALLPSNAIISSGSVNVPSPFPYTASAGFCGAQCGNSYAVYLVAEDLQEPPNRQDTVLREVLFFNCSSAPSARLYSNATEVCTQEFLVGRAKLALALSPGSAGFPTGPTVPLLGSVRRGFKVFRNKPPGSEVRVQASLDRGGQVVLVEDLNRPSQKLEHKAVTTGKLARRVWAVSRVPGLWTDAITVRVQYQVTDIIGRPQVYLSGVTVSARVTGALGTSNTFPCDLPSPTTGIGMCSSSLAENNLPPPGGAVQTGAIVVTITSPFGTAEISASSEPVAVELHPPPAWTPMASPGVFISWPVRAVLPGSSFTARVYAYSPDKCVNEFLLPVFFDPSHVSLDFAEENQALYSPAVKVEDRLGQGVFSLSVQSAKSPSTCSQRRGSRVYLAQLRFTVVAAAAPPAVLSDVMSCGDDSQSSNYVRLSEDGNPTPFNTLDPRGRVGQIHDRQGGRALRAQLEIYSRQINGINTYLENAELISTAVFTGQQVSSRATTIAIFNDDTQATVTPRCILDSGGSQVAALSGCSLTVVAPKPANLPRRSNLIVTYQGFELTLRFLVWYPVSAAVHAEDSELHRLISAPDLPPGCSLSSSWQQTPLSVTATFDSFGLDSVQVGVTDLVEFSSSNPSLLRVQGSTAFGVGASAGTASVGIVLKSADVIDLEPETIQLVDDVKCIVSLRTVVITGGELGVSGLANETLPDQLDIGNGVLDVALYSKQVLDMEGAEGHVRVYATFSDGATADVTAEPGMTLTSADDSIIEVLAGQGFPPQDPRVRVTSEVGQGSVCGELLFAKWSVCGLELASGTGAVYVDLPTPTSLELQTDRQRLTCPGDPAAGLGLPTTAKLQVKIGFDQGGLQDYTLDDRIVFNVTSGSELCEVVKTPGQQAFIQAAASPDACEGLCTVEAAFGSLAAEVEVYFVKLQDVTACIKPWYHSGNLQVVEMGSLVEENDAQRTCGGPVEVRRLACGASPAEFEQVAVVGIARLTDGELFDVTGKPGTSFSSAGPAVALEKSVSSAQVVNRVVPRQPGEAELVAAFSGVRSAPVVVFVLDELDYVAEVSIAADYCSGADSPSLAPCTSTFCPSTFRGSRGAQRQLRISAVMSSGFRYPDLERYLNSQPPVFPIASILAFSSDKAREVSVSPSGTTTLQGNSGCGPVRLLSAVRDQCADPQADAPPSTALEVYGNLEPLELDVDLGHEVGPPIHISSPCSDSVQVGGRFQVPVRIRSTRAPLQSFSLLIRYDEGLLEVEGCDRKVAEKHRFSCNYQLTAGEVRIVVFNEDGVNGAAEFRRAAVLLAAVNFRVAAAGDALLAGNIIEAAQAGLNGASVINTEVDAGRVSFCAGSGGRRMLLELPSLAPPALSPTRRLLQGDAGVACGGCTLERHLALLGDVNFDCKVDLQYDLRFLSLAGSLTASRSREDYYSRLQAFLCVPGQCTDQQIPSCFRDHGKNMTEHQKLQLDLFHILPAPSGGYEVEDCTNLEGIEAFRRSGFDNSIIPQCTWRQLNTPAAGGPIAGVDGVLLNDVQPVTSNVRQFFAEVAAKSTLLLGGFTAGELAANQLNLSVSLVNYKPEEFATTPLTGKDAEAIAVYLDLRSEFPEALRFESPTTGQELQVETSSGSSGAGQLVQLAFEPSTLEFSASVRPNGRSTFKGDELLVGLIVAQRTPAGQWISVQPWYGTPEYRDWRIESGLSTREGFQETYMPYTTVEVGSGVLPCDCTYPSASAIRNQGLQLKLCLTGKARVRFVVLPEPLPPGVQPPTLAEVDALQGPAGGPEPVVSGAFDYAAPEGKAAGELRIFPQALINTTTNESATLQVPVVTLKRLADVPSTGRRYLIYLVLSKQTPQGQVYWPSSNEVLSGPYEFEPGQPAVPFPQVVVPALGAFTGQGTIHFVVQDDAAIPPSPTQIVGQRDGSGQAPEFAGSFVLQLPSSPVPFSIFGNVSIGGGEGSPQFHRIQGLDDRLDYSIYLALDGRGMLQSTGVPVTLGNVTVPDTQAPTFLYLDVTKDTSRLALGFFSLELDLEVDEASNVTYAIYKKFDCTSEPGVVDVLLGESAPATCANRNLADPVAYGSFELAGGERTTVQISDVSLSPFKLEDASCLPHSLDKVSALFDVYLVAQDIGDTLPCIAAFCSDAGAVPSEEDGCAEITPRQCGQADISVGCPCPQPLLSSGGNAWVRPAELCHNNVQGTAVTSRPPGANWVVWRDGQPQADADRSPTAEPAKVEVDLINDVEEPAQATILEGLIEEYEDRIVVPFQLSAPGRLSFMLTNITLPTELDVLVGSTGRPSIQGFQVANGRDSVPEPGSTSLRSQLDITGCPGQGEIFPGSPYYLFYVTTDMNNLRRSSLQQLTTLRSARTTARIAPSTSQPP